ncbi:tyrosine-type recombinase/integrase [Candidatus Enterovibrio escicola]|uniref:tyrosine-type recombinase/integrase n=1 Tax=Candidatus Enterovibrio escicola TaxID=1927127 RepID=UPI0012382038|nr:integrase family protein [Candidatus Enterovibrio escacola]
MSNKRQIYTKSKIKKFVASSKEGKYYIAPNFFLEITKSGKASWKTRFRFNGKAYERTIGTYGENNAYFMSFKDALDKAEEFRDSLDIKENPLERSHTQIKTVDDLVTEFFAKKQLKYKKERKVYEEIKPILGEKLVRNVTSMDVERVVKSIVDSGRKSIAAIAVGLLKNVFDYASIHKLIFENVAAHLSKEHHAGQKDSDRTVNLKKSQIKKAFKVFQQFPLQAKLTNQCAIALYIIFGMRKSELLKAKWTDFDEDERELIIRPTKTGKDELQIIVPETVLPIFRYLKHMANGSPFIFPALKDSTTEHLSESTLNAMIRKFFKVHKTKQVEFDNPMGQLNVPRFYVHDLRRTFTTIASDHSFPSLVVELALNHKKKRSMKPYDFSTRPMERGEMYELMAEVILPLTNLIPLVQEQLQENIAPSLPQAA